MEEQTRQERFEERYASGDIPWDDDLPPPEIIALTNELPSGKALDLGCGYGRASIYLARHSWHVDGVDFVSLAIERAAERARAAGVAEKTRFYVSSVSDLSFLSGPYDLALDIGCMHSFSGGLLLAYRHALLRLLRPGAHYLLFAHLRDKRSDDEDELRWITEEAIFALFAEGFTLEQAELGWTQVPDKPRWRSGWFRFRRLP